jgi:hypothetical protein
MSTPAETGGKDGEIKASDGANWRWWDRHQAWFPDRPTPFQAFTDSNGTRWTWNKSLQDWQKALLFFDSSVVDRQGGRVAIREAQDQPEEK